MNFCKIYLILIIPFFLLLSGCKKCAEPARYTFNNADREWMIYKVGQKYTYKSNLGNVRTYKVVSIKDTTNHVYSKASRSPIIGKDCPNEDYYFDSEEVSLININNTNLKIIIGFESRKATSLGIRFKDSLNIEFPIGLPISYIDKNQKSFVNGQLYQNYKFTVDDTYFADLTIGGRHYINAYKQYGFQGNDTSHIYYYYTKLIGIIKLEFNNETWELQ